MRRARITYKGAFHHVMNRGINGEAIFETDELKDEFLKLLFKKSRKHRLRILAYCLMNNHYHLVLQNTTGKMALFQKDLNGQYGAIYRKCKGGKGYIFQGRYKSTLIQDNEYLMGAIFYVLQNPVRAKIVKYVEEYHWTSLRELDNDIEERITDQSFVLELIGDRKVFIDALNGKMTDKLPITKSRYGDILGTEKFIQDSIRKFDRRSEPHPTKMGRIDDGWFEPVEKVIQEFEKDYGIDIDRMVCNSWEDKRIRGEFLIRLRDLAGLTYVEIKDFSIFNGVKLNSLAKLYQDTLRRKNGQQSNKVRHRHH